MHYLSHPSLLSERYPNAFGSIFYKFDRSDFIRFMTVKRFLAENTVKGCTVNFNIFRNWMVDNNRNYDKDAVEDFIEYLMLIRKVKGNTISSYYSMLNQLELYLLDRDLLTKPFLDEFRRPPKTQPHTFILTPNEIERILYAKRKYNNRNGILNDNLESFYTTFIMFLALTGCRFSEAATLKVRSINFDEDKAVFEITKTKTSREVFFTDPLKSRLQKLAENKSKNDLLFSYALGKRLKLQTFAAELKKRATFAAVKKRVYPHLFRHSFATQLLTSGVEITYVASLLGHKRVQTTYESYVHLADSKRKQAMFLHPLIRKGSNTKTVINTIKANLQNFRLENDDRFNYQISEENGSLSFKLESKA